MDDNNDEDIENGYCEKCIYNEEAERCYECDEDFSEYKQQEERDDSR